jgi:hypothetical protein
MVDGRLEHGICPFLNFTSDLWTLTGLFGLWSRDVSVSKRLVFFELNAVIYGLDHGSPMSASPFDYLVHTISSYLLLFFKTARLDNVHGRCSLVGPRC